MDLRGLPRVRKGHVEAIEVLNAINVMTGDADSSGNLTGTFRPGDEVKRSEMVRIMAFLMDLDYDYYIGANPFNDMVGHWAEKYAAACAANGIIYGRTDTTYDPDATVTAVEAASMLMRALGYFQNPAVDYPDGFEISTIRQAGRITLFNKVDVKTNEPMTRNDVAQLILNTLQSGMVEPSNNSKIDVTVGDAQVTIGSTGKVKAAQHADGDGDRNISKKYNSLPGSGTTDSEWYKVYGDNDSVYLTAKLDAVRYYDGSGNYAIVITGASNSTTGIDNVDMTTYDTDDALDAVNSKRTTDLSKDVVDQYSSGVYTLYNHKGYVIAAMVVGKDNGAKSNLVYVHTSKLDSEEYVPNNAKATDGEWHWVRKVIYQGEVFSLREAGDNISYIGPEAGHGNMQQGKWYKVHFNANEEVVGAEDVFADKSDLVKVDPETGTGEWVDQPEYLVPSYQKYNTVVFQYEYDTRKDFEKLPSLSANGQTLYVTTERDTGVRVASDVKTYMEQKINNDTKNYSGTTVKDLENYIKGLNEDKEYFHKFELNLVVLEGAVRYVVIIDEVTSTYTPGTNTGSSMPGVKVVIPGNDNSTAATQSLLLACFGVAQPTQKSVISNILADWATNERNLTNVEVWESSAGVLSVQGLKSDGWKSPEYQLDINTGIKAGLRVLYWDPATDSATSDGYEFLAARNNASAGVRVNAEYTNPTLSSGYALIASPTGGYTAYKKSAAENTWTWSAAVPYVKGGSTNVKLTFDANTSKVYIYNEDGPIGNTGVYEPDTSNEVTLRSVGNKDITISDAVTVTLTSAITGASASTINDCLSLVWKDENGNKITTSTKEIAAGGKITAEVTVKAPGFTTAAPSGNETKLKFGNSSGGSAGTEYKTTTVRGSDYGTFDNDGDEQSNDQTYTFKDSKGVAYGAGAESVIISVTYTVDQDVTLEVTLTPGTPTPGTNS